MTAYRFGSLSTLAVAATLALQPAAHAQAPVFNRPAGSQVPFSHSVRVGDVVYVSGMIGMGADGKMPEDLDTQIVNTMGYIERILKVSGNSLNDIFKCTVAMRDIADWEAFSKQFATYFAQDRLPAQMAFGSTGLVYGARFELECLAVAVPDKAS